MTSVSLLAASLKRQLKQPQETSEFVLVYAAYFVTAKKYTEEGRMCMG